MVAIRSSSLAKWLRIRVRVRARARNAVLLFTFFSLVLQDVVNIFVLVASYGYLDNHFKLGELSLSLFRTTSNGKLGRAWKRGYSHMSCMGSCIVNTSITREAILNESEQKETSVKSF